MSKYTYVVMEDSQVFSYSELCGGCVKALEAYDSEERANDAVEVYTNLAKLHEEDYPDYEIPKYYVLRVVRYS